MAHLQCQHAAAMILCGDVMYTPPTQHDWLLFGKRWKSVYFGQGRVISRLWAIHSMGLQRWTGVSRSPIVEASTGENRSRQCGITKALMPEKHKTCCYLIGRTIQHGFRCILQYCAALDHIELVPQHPLAIGRMSIFNFFRGLDAKLLD